MKKLQAFLFLLILLIPLAGLRAFQDSPAPRLEITGVNSAQMPAVVITANVYDPLGQPMLGLTAENFTLLGDLAPDARITRVENVSDDNLPFATVLLIDVSSSMTGAPMENARAAAQAFVENIGANDPVAIMTFGTSVRVVQDYTTDKAALSAVIASLDAGGVTALYQGAYEAIQVAAASPTPRRAVILLSDGAEYGRQSRVEREAAADAALSLGVPVYAIGLGYNSIDRTYLQGLSATTSSRFYESPSPEQLTEIYTGLAAQLRSQYILTLDAPQPLDGTQYTLQLQVTTPQGSADASAVLRAPIPVPILSLPALNAPLTEPTEVTATLLADDDVENVSFQVGENDPVIASAESPVFSIDPVAYLPGDYLLTASATDANGDTGSAVVAFTVAALPSEITLSPDLVSLGAIAEPLTVTLEISGQTPANNASVAFNDGEKTQLSQPFGFTIDPLDFAPGANNVTVTVTNEGGVSTAQTFIFEIAALPPVITVTGVEDGQNIAAPVSFTVETRAQQGAASLNVSINELLLEPDANVTGDASVYTIDPMDFSPGVNTLSVQATAANGATSQQQIDLVIAALPPQIIVNGLQAGETLDADRAVTLEFISQSPVVHVAVFVDGVDLAHLVTPPYGVTLGVLDYAPGDHVLRFIADNADGQQTTLDLPFSIAAEPAASATAVAVTATQQAVATATQQAAATQIAVQATQVAAVTGTQVAVASATGAAEATQAQQAVIAAGQTQVAQSTQVVAATGTQFAVASATAAIQKTQNALDAATQVAIDTTATQIKVEATRTQAALATSGAQQSALNSQATATQSAVEATQEAQATQSAQATATEIANTTQLANDLATLDAQATATEHAESTRSAQATATRSSADIQATQAVQATATEIANATQLANDLATLETHITATAAAEATQAVEATRSALDASATQVAANATATEAAQAQNVAQATATQAAQIRLDNQATARAQAQNAMQVATRDALATSNAEGRQSAQATQSARATRNARSTATQVANATAAVEQSTQAALDALEATATELIVNATATRNALETLTVANATATQSVLDVTATQSAALAQVTQVAADALATSNAVATAERATQLTVTAQSIIAAATAAANATTTGQANAAATDEQSTRSAGATATSIAQATLDTRLTAVGPTATQIEGAAQTGPSLTPSPQPTLTEIQASEAASSTSNVTPIVIVVIVVVLIILVLVLIMRGRGSPGMRR
ncbi:MAG: VWA domain-containing protein [Chloroflexota bacterium]